MILRSLELYINMLQEPPILMINGIDNVLYKFLKRQDKMLGCW